MLLLLTFLNYTERAAGHAERYSASIGNAYCSFFVARKRYFGAGLSMSVFKCLSSISSGTQGITDMQYDAHQICLDGFCSSAYRLQAAVTLEYFGFASPFGRGHSCSLGGQLVKVDTSSLS